MKTPPEIWFKRTAIRGFGAVHWKGPVFVALMTIVGVVFALFATVTATNNPILAVVATLMAVGALVTGQQICARHTERD